MSGPNCPIWSIEIGDRRTTAEGKILRRVSCEMSLRLRLRSLTPTCQDRTLGARMAYGSEVVACGDDFVPGTEVPGFYLEALCASFGF